MKRTPVAPADLAASVIAVPPLARAPDGSLSRADNEAIITHLGAGGVTSFMYGGNANFFHLTLDEFAAALDLLTGLVPEGAWLLPSIGPDFGKARDQLRLIRSHGFPTAMLLPSAAPTTPEGIADGITRLSDALAGPVVLYLKADRYVVPQDVAALQAEGRIAAVKYAVVRETPAIDPYLAELVALCGTDRLVSGIGERPVIEHWRHFGLRAFTSGSVSVAPNASTALHAALRAGDFEQAAALRALFLELEDLRDTHSPIRVLHEAVEAAGIARTGPLGPYLSNIRDPETLAAIARAARRLADADGKLRT